MTALQRAIALDYAVSDRLSQRGLSPYLDRVVIDSRPQPRRFGEVAEWWQRDRNDAIVAAVEHAAGFRESYDGPLNFYFGYSKGHDKTSFIARLFNWLLGYSKRHLKVYAAAADADQAKLIRDAMVAERSLNPWLKPRVQVLTKAAWGRGGSLEILASDSASAQGKLPDVIVFDEITHWHRQDFFDALYSARNKRPACVAVVLTNAGFKGSWQWNLRETARQSPRWRFFESPERTQLASWMNAAAIAEDRKLLTPTEAKRLLDNIWIDPGEESGFVTLAEAEACVDAALVERAVGVGPPQTAVPTRYIAGVDYGPKRDRTALSVCHLDADGRVVVDRLDCWHRRGGEVLVAEVEDWCRRVHRDFNRPRFVIDPYQMLGTVQTLRGEGCDVAEFSPRGGTANYEMAATLRSLLVSRRIGWPATAGLPGPPHSPPYEDLRGDTFAVELANLLLRATPSGYRFDHTSGRHDDRAVAVGMAALELTKSPPPPPAKPPQPLPQPPLNLHALPHAAARGLFGVNR